MKKHLSCLLALLLIVSTVAAQDDSKKPEKITAEELISRHIASIGTPEALAAVKSRVITGRHTFEGGQISATKTPLETQPVSVQLASDPERMLFVMISDPKEHFQKFAYDGKHTSIAHRSPIGRNLKIRDQPPPLAGFLKATESLLADGLINGALSSAWPLLDLTARKGKVEYAGVEKVGDRWLHKLKYFSRRGTARITLFFEPDTYRHVASEYYYAEDVGMGVTKRYQERRYSHTLTERFSDFKRVGDLTLPFTYTLFISDKSSLNVDHFPQTYTIKVANVYYNEVLAPSVFKVS